MVKIEISTRKNKKYMSVTPLGRIVHWGDRSMQHYIDKTPLQYYKKLNHYDKERRRRYLARAKGIKDKDGKLTWNNKESANYYSIHYLW